MLYYFIRFALFSQSVQRNFSSFFETKKHLFIKKPEVKNKIGGRKALHHGAELIFGETFADKEKN
jgi:hypothetical protein